MKTNVNSRSGRPIFSTTFRKNAGWVKFVRFGLYSSSLLRMFHFGLFGRNEAHVRDIDFSATFKIRKSFQLRRWSKKPASRKVICPEYIKRSSLIEFHGDKKCVEGDVVVNRPTGCLGLRPCQRWENENRFCVSGLWLPRQSKKRNKVSFVVLKTIVLFALFPDNVFCPLTRAIISEHSIDLMMTFFYLFSREKNRTLRLDCVELKF